MQRLEIPLESASLLDSILPSSVGSSVATLDCPQFTHQTAAPYTTFAPLHYETDYAYPLVVWLHDTGGDERDLKQVMPLVSLQNYVAVAPRGSQATEEQDDYEGCEWKQAGDPIEEAEARVLECVAMAKRRYHIHTDRVFLAGYGSGGTMALRVAWNHPERFAGVASLCGAIPREFSPLRRINEMRHLTCLLASAKQSQRYSESQACQDLRLLHAAGCTLNIRQYLCGDVLMTDMLSDLNHWIMDLVCAGR